MPLGKPVQGLSGNELLCNLSFERDVVGTLSGHGFHPLKAQLPLSIHLSQPVRPQGRTPLQCPLCANNGHNPRLSK